MKVTAKVIAHAFDSKNAIQFFPGDVVELDLANQDQRKLVWLKTPRGKWIFDFDRASSSNTVDRIFFCKDCGQPFEKLQEHGTHANIEHKPDKKSIKGAKAIEDDAEEERLLAERRAAEAAETAQAGT